MEDKIVETENYKISTNIITNWGSAFQGKIIIENVGKTTYNIRENL